MGFVLIGLGLLAIWARDVVSDVMNAYPLQWSFMRTATPRTAVLMGIGWIVMGVALIFAG